MAAMRCAVSLSRASHRASHGSSHCTSPGTSTSASRHTLAHADTCPNRAHAVGASPPSFRPPPFLSHKLRLPPPGARQQQKQQQRQQQLLRRWQHQQLPALQIVFSAGTNSPTAVAAAAVAATANRPPALARPRARPAWKATDEEVVEALRAVNDAVKAEGVEMAAKADLSSTCACPPPFPPTPPPPPFSWADVEQGKALPPPLRLPKALGSRLSNRAMTKVLQQISDWRTALRFFQWMKCQAAYKAEAFHYNVLLKSVCKGKQWHVAQRLVDEMERLGGIVVERRRSVWRAAGSEEGEGLESAKAGNENVLPDNYTYSTIIGSATRHRAYMEAVKWVDRMATASRHVPDEVMLSTIMHALARAGHPARAARVFSHMRDAGWPMDATTLATALNVYASAGAFRQAEQLYRELKQEAGTADGSEEVEEEEEEEEAGRAAASAASRAVGEGGEGRGGRQADGGMGLGAGVYHTMLVMYRRMRESTRGMAVLNEMLEAGVPRTAYTHSLVVAMLASDGKVDAALNYFLRVKEEEGGTHWVDGGTEAKSSTTVNRSTTVGEMVVEEERSMGGERVSEEKRRRRSSDRQVDGVLYSTVLSVCRKHARLAMGSRLWDEMRRDGIAPVEGAYRAMLGIYAELGEMERVREVAREMTERLGVAMDLKAYSSVVYGLGLAGRADLVEEVLQEMAYSGVEPDAWLANTLLHLVATSVLSCPTSQGDQQSAEISSQKTQTLLRCIRRIDVILADLIADVIQQGSCQEAAGLVGGEASLEEEACETPLLPSSPSSPMVPSLPDDFRQRVDDALGDARMVVLRFRGTERRLQKQQQQQQQQESEEERGHSRVRCNVLMDIFSALGRADAAAVVFKAGCERQLYPSLVDPTGHNGGTLVLRELSVAAARLALHDWLAARCTELLEGVEAERQGGEGEAIVSSTMAEQSAEVSAAAKTLESVAEAAAAAATVAVAVAAPVTEAEAPLAATAAAASAVGAREFIIDVGLGAFRRSEDERGELAPSAGASTTTSAGGGVQQTLREGVVAELKRLGTPFVSDVQSPQLLVATHGDLLHYARHQQHRQLQPL